MDIKRITNGYFNKTEEERQEIVHTVLTEYLTDMIAQDGNLISLRSHLIVLKDKSIINQDYEVTDVLQQCIDGITEVLGELSGFVPQEGDDDGM